MLPGLMLKPDAEEEDGNAILKHVDGSWRLNPGCHGIGQASGLA